MVRTTVRGHLLQRTRSTDNRQRRLPCDQLELNYPPLHPFTTSEMVESIFEQGMKKGLSVTWISRIWVWGSKFQWTEKPLWVAEPTSVVITIPVLFFTSSLMQLNCVRLTPLKVCCGQAIFLHHRFRIDECFLRAFVFSLKRRPPNNSF